MWWRDLKNNLKNLKKLLTREHAHDNINELRVKHGQHKESKQLQSTSRNEVAR